MKVPAEVEYEAMCEARAKLTPAERDELDGLRLLLNSDVRGLGEKGTLELAGKVGMWLVRNPAPAPTPTSSHP